MAWTVSPWELRIRERLVAREDSALAELYDQFGPFVYGLALRVTRDSLAAEDVAQDVFLSMWERPAAFDPTRGSMRAWLGTLAHRRAVDWVRREVGRRQRDLRQAQAPPRSPDVDEMVIALTVAERVRAALEELPEAQRAAVHLAYFGGQTYRQVARTLGIPEGTAKSRLRAGLRRIALAVEDEAVERWS